MKPSEELVKRFDNFMDSLYDNSKESQLGIGSSGLEKEAVRISEQAVDVVAMFFTEMPANREMIEICRGLHDVIKGIMPMIKFYQRTGGS